MKSMIASRRLLTLSALPTLLARRPSRDHRQEPSLDTRMPDDALLAELQAQALQRRQPHRPLPLSRHDIELALDAGTRRYFPPRGETEVLERH